MASENRAFKDRAPENRASQPSCRDLKQLEAQLLAERQAYYGRAAVQRRTIRSVLQELSQEQSLHASLQERLERLLNPPPTR
ncbi:MAG: hypothetical protein K2X43_11355 [Hyphomonadaceae bacterium]|jgi:ubiquinone biosynthesis protein UbiJ|nr:hypothetical protein [Hyphomonadaceae bacterium]